jgi:2-aminoadipate transaminase
MPVTPMLSRRVRDLAPSPIREILQVIERPGMISFAGGLPAPESFPRLDAARLPAGCLQYGPSEGEPALRQRIAEDLRAIGLVCDAAQILVLSGSQQGIDLVGKLFIDRGTPVAVESPTYLAALQVFRFFGARLVALDAHAADAPRPAFAYAIPTFQNPTGHCYDAAERTALARRCDADGIVLFEDDPYRDLAYDRCERTPVCARLGRASWIYLGSFSKTLAPGLRLGFLAASPDLVAPLTRLKQAADLHSSRVSQWLVLQQLDDPARGERLAAVVAGYRRKRDVFARLLARHLGELATWRTPRGGLFFWITLKHIIDTRALLPGAIERGVAFMPGEPFFAGATRAAGALRLNFSHATEAQADAGLRILAEQLRQVAPRRERARFATAQDVGSGECATARGSPVNGLRPAIVEEY